MLRIIGIENVDLSRVLTIGASSRRGRGRLMGVTSIMPELGGCLGAFSLSPGGYLTVSYADDVALLENELLPRPAWCQYSDGDNESASACQEANGQLYVATEYEGHGAWNEPDQSGCRPQSTGMNCKVYRTLSGL